MFLKSCSIGRIRCWNDCCGGRPWESQFLRNRAGRASLDLPHANSWFEFLLIALPQVQVPSATCLSSPGNRHPVSSEAAELEEYARKYEAIGRQSSNRRASTSTTPIIDQLRKENGQASTFWPGGEGRDGRESVLTTASQVNIIRRIGRSLSKHLFKGVRPVRQFR